MSLTGIRDENLSVDEVIVAVSDPRAGAVVTFVGAVRNHSAGREVTRL